MTQPPTTLRALDLFCGAGGVSVGLQRAGFEVTGVDIKPMPRYRGGTFVQADAMEVLQETDWLLQFDFIWASPPCQGYTSLRHTTGGRQYPMLIEAVRERLTAWQMTEARSRFGGLPRLWIIENVPGAPLRHGFILCGGSFGLGSAGRQLKRHRLFEPSWPVLAPPCACDRREKLGVYGSSDGGKKHRCNGRRGGYQGRMPEKREAMGIDWMNREELNQAIPPAYADWIGTQAIAALVTEQGARR